MPKQPQIAFAGIPSVNLLPRAEVDRRERISLTRAWAFAAVGAVVVAVVAIAAAAGLWFAAGQRLAAEQARATDLAVERSGYSEVSAALANRSTLESFRSVSMGADFDWTPVLARVTGAMPASVQLAAVALNPGAAPTGEPESGVGAVGRLTFNGVNLGDQAATVAALSGVPGVLHVDALGLVSAGEGVYEFGVTIQFDQTIYSNKYPKDEGQ